MIPLRTATVLAALLAALAPAQQTGIPGHYEGKLQAQGREIAVTLDLDRNAKQAWIGHMTVAPNPNELPLDNISVSGEQVSWTVPAIPGSPKFDGKWENEAKALHLTAHIGGMDLPLELRRTAAARVLVPEPSAPLPKEFEGKWDGSLDTGSQTLRITLALDRDEEGRAVGNLLSIDQGNVKVPLGEIRFAGNEITFTARAVNGSYKGRINPEKDQISGDWTQFDNTLPLVLKKQPAVKP